MTELAFKSLMPITLHDIDTKMIGQLYKIPIVGPLAGHDPAGDPIIEGPDDKPQMTGFVVREIKSENKCLMVLFKSSELPPKAELVLERCDPAQVMREESEINPIITQKFFKYLL